MEYNQNLVKAVQEVRAMELVEEHLLPREIEGAKMPAIVLDMCPEIGVAEPIVMDMCVKGEVVERVFIGGQLKQEIRI